MRLLDITDSQSTYDLLDKINSLRDLIYKLKHNIYKINSLFNVLKVPVEPINEIDQCLKDMERYISYSMVMYIMCKKDKVNRLIECAENFFYFILGINVHDEGGLLMACLKYKVNIF